MNKRIFSALLCLFLLVSLCLPVYATTAEETEETFQTRVQIASAEDLLQFAENCRLDSYSVHMLVTLEADLDLTGCPFTGIPIFSGTFDGQGHSICGVDLQADGSVQGLFRYLTADALVQNLNVTGQIHPGGSRNQIGGIAGENAGTILGCNFSGTVSGCDAVGGIAGSNTVTGVIENCRTEGEIQADHFGGGIVGENAGVIRSCTNQAQINVTPAQNTVEIADITLETLTNTEAVNTATDMGGITGISSGVIRDCDNLGDVGYPLMGYNIGGIAGTQSGYITGCTNRGQIQGRKEVGGIVGQMEPASVIEYTEDTLQILKGQLNTLSGLVNKASGNAQANAGQIGSQINKIQKQTDKAKDALESLIPEQGSNQLPDVDTILAAQNTLTKSIDSMGKSLRGIMSATQSTISGLTRDLNAVSSQIGAMGRTLNGASDNLGGTITDVSDQDTEDQLTGKVENCYNFGSVLADLNAGGIAGAMAPENDMDILQDWEILGEESMNFSSELRAVVLSCENYGSICGKKQNVGGIAGWQSMGLVKASTNTGTVDGAAADYVGGISGLSTGFLRKNNAKCQLSGSTYVGGIAGSATIVSDSLSQVKILEGKERLGGILGYAEDTDAENPIANNHYLVIDRDPGAIDGISYQDLAQPVELESFLAMEDLPQVFQAVTIRFVFEDADTREISLVPGQSLALSQIPAVPEKANCSGQWEGLADAQLTNILFDMTFETVYTSYRTTIESTQLLADGMPLALAEGSFSSQAVLEVTDATQLPALGEKQQLLAAWSIRLNQQADTLRIHLPEGFTAETGTLLVCGASGNWEEISFTQTGSYGVFPIDETQLEIALVAEAKTLYTLYWIAGAVLLLLVLALLIFRIRKNRKSAKVDISTETP